jgi:hypothetical protein
MLSNWQSQYSDSNLQVLAALDEVSKRRVGFINRQIPMFL